MDPISKAALEAFDSTITAFLPESAPHGLNRDVRLLPEAIRPSGIGGYIGAHPEPRGAIYGRRLQGILQISIRGGNDNNARSYLDQIVHGLLTQQHGDLRRAGIQSITLRPECADARCAQFDLSFEYQHKPTASSDLIQTLDLSVDTNITPHNARFLWDIASRTLSDTDTPLADFYAPEDVDLNASSPLAQWNFQQTGQCISQDAAARGGQMGLNNVRKSGPQLLWRPSGEKLKVHGFIAEVEFESGSPDGIGLVFGRSNAENLFYFIASKRHQYHLFGCRESGNYRFIGTPAHNVGFGLHTRHVLNITVYNTSLIATLDGVRTLEVTSTSPVPAGEIGFFTHNNNDARFYRIRLIEFI